jgi:hypothetical protein
MPPLSMAENPNIAVLEDVLPPFLMVDPFPSEVETIEVRGGTVSTVQLNDASDRSLFPTLSWALVSRV